MPPATPRRAPRRALARRRARPAAAAKPPAAAAGSEAKARLLGLLGPAVDRGLAASAADAAAIAAAAAAVETTSDELGDDELGAGGLAGRWELLYSSGFAGGSLGGSRPGPPAAGPVALGGIFQDIGERPPRGAAAGAAAAGQLYCDNVVTLRLKAPLPLLPEAAEVSLEHSAALAGRTLTICYESTRVNGAFYLPELPGFLKPPPLLRSAAFETSYLDGELRISRGDRGELRVYRRHGRAPPP